MERTRRSISKAGASVRQAVVRRHRPDYKIVAYATLLTLLGLVVMYAIGAQRANVLNIATGGDLSGTYFFIKQTVSVLFAVAAFVLMTFIPFDFLKKHAVKLLLLGFGSCALLAVAGALNLGIAQCALGACRWFSLGGLGTIQPAEILKFGLLVYVASFLGMRMKQGLMNDVNRTLIPVASIVGLATIFIIFIQKDMGTGIAMLSIIACMLMVAGVNRKIGAILLGAAVVAGLLLIVVAPHRIDRVMTFFAGDNAVQDDSNYHITHAKIAIGSGGLAGVGIGNSVQATGYLPEAINDSVFAIMGETFGFIGLTVILLLFTGLLMRLLRTSERLTDPYMKLIAAGVFGWLGSHVILNVAAMIGVAPLTGITLPLLSFGGTSMIFIAAALGLAFQLSRHTIHGTIQKESSSYENSSSRRGVGRPRYANRRSR